jgi:hypothetical protein
MLQPRWAEAQTGLGCVVNFRDQREEGDAVGSGLNELLLCLRRDQAVTLANQALSGTARAEFWLSATWHGVRPLVARALAVKGEDQFQKFLRSNVIKTLHITSELLRLLALLEDAGVMAVPFKGPILGQQLYGDIALREYCDLDILVREECVGPALELLRAQGYELDVDCGPYDERAFIRNWNHYHLLNPATGVEVELHWRFAPALFCFPLEVADVWAHLETLRVGDREVPVFANEDLLLFLVAHGAKHGWSSLRWICDVVELLATKPDMDWDLVVSRAQQGGGMRMLLLGLQIASQMGAPVPEHLRDEIRDEPIIAKLASSVWRRLSEARDPGLVEGCLFAMRVRERLSDKLKTGLLFLVTPTATDQDFLPLPASAHSLYWLLRPIRIGYETAAGLWLALRRMQPIKSVRRHHV